MPIKPTSLGAVAALEQHIDTRWVLSYAAGLGLTDPLYLDDSQPDGPFVVPMFCVCIEWEVALKARNASLGLTPDELRQGVHAWQRSEFVAPIRAGMTVRTTSEVVHMRRTSAGTYVVVRYGTHDTASGALLTDSLSGTMFRGVPMTADAPESLGEVPSAAPAPVSDTAPSFVHEHHVGAGYPHVYTECARIWNPIHTEERVARAAGLSSILLHGTATWSLAAVAMAQAHAGDEGLRTLRLLEGQFRKPVLPRDTLRIRLLDSQKDSVSFDVHTDRGDTAMSGGYARFGLT